MSTKCKKLIASLYIMKQVFTNRILSKCYITCKTIQYLPIDNQPTRYVWQDIFRRTIYICRYFSSGKLSIKYYPITSGKICCASSSMSTHRFWKFFHKLLLFHWYTRLHKESFSIMQSHDIDKALLFIHMNKPIIFSAKSVPCSILFLM